MEKSELYNVLEKSVLPKWREHDNGTDNRFKQDEDRISGELKLQLNEKGQSLLNSYALAICNRMEYLHYNLGIKLLNLGIKMGMEFEKAFAEFAE